MKNKKYLVPTLLISSALLFTGCSSNDESQAADTPSSSSSASPSETFTGDTQLAEGYVAPPEGMDSELSLYFAAPSISTEEGWGMYKDAGAKTYEEDPSTRNLNMDDWIAMRDSSDAQQSTIIFGEVFYDAEYSAKKVSEYLAANPEATMEQLASQPDLIVNRYPGLGSMELTQDESSGFYFVLLKGLNPDVMPTISGSLVQQPGITPDFK